MYLFITISGKAQADTAVLSDGRTFQKSHVSGIHEMIQIITDQPAPHRHCMCPGVILLMSLHACSTLQIVYSYYYIIPCGIIKLYCRTALHYAVCKKNLPIVDLLLNCDIVTGLFMQDDEGNNPLHKV